MKKWNGFILGREWAILRTRRGSVAAIHGNGIHKGPAWPEPGGREEFAAHGDQAGFARVQGGSFARHEGKQDSQMRLRADERIAAAFRARRTLVEEDTLALAQTV